MLRQIYDAIYVTLRDDAELRSLMGLTSTGDAEADELSAMSRIQKRRFPVDMVENLPIISFYKVPSPSDPKNDQVYDAIFFFDVYTKNDVNLGMLITERLWLMFEGKFLNVEGLTSFKSRWVDGAEFETDSVDLYGVNNIIKFSVERPSEDI